MHSRNSGKAHGDKYAWRSTIFKWRTDPSVSFIAHQPVRQKAWKEQRWPAQFLLSLLFIRFSRINWAVCCRRDGKTHLQRPHRGSQWEGAPCVPVDRHLERRNKFARTGWMKRGGRKRFECSVARNYLRVCGCMDMNVCEGRWEGMEANLVIIGKRAATSVGWKRAADKFSLYA